MSELDLAEVGSRRPGHYGADATGVTLSEITIATAWNVQGDPARAPFRAEAQRLFGVALPLDANATVRGDAWTALWLGPRSWLLIARGETAAAMPWAAWGTHRDELNAVGGALFDVSASRVAYAVGGTHAAAVLAKRCPLDFHSSTFPAGGCAQSMLGHVNALIVRADAEPVFTVLVARSFARDAWRSLCVAAAQYGYEVGAPRSYS